MAHAPRATPRPVPSVLLALFLTLSGPLSAAPMSGYTFATNGGTFEATASATVGFRFRADQALLLTALGIVDSGAPGLNNSHEVGIWSDAGLLLASVTVPSGGVAAFQDGFRYANLGAALQLAAGGIYRVGAVFVLGDGDNMIESVSRTAAAGVSLLDTPAFSTRSAPGAVLAFPTNSSGPEAAAANFLFDTTPALPLPATHALLALGLAGLALGRRAAALNRSPAWPEHTRPRTGTS